MSDSKGTHNKRRCVDEENEGAETEAETAPRQLVKLPEEMRAAMGGRKFCNNGQFVRLPRQARAAEASRHAP